MKKHFLILMLMALLPMAGWALTLDGSKFQAINIDYGTAVLPEVTCPNGPYVLNQDYTVVAEFFYQKIGESYVEIPAASLAQATTGLYYRKVNGINSYANQYAYVDFWIYGITIADGNVANFAEVTYTGSKITPSTTGKVTYTIPAQDAQYYTDYEEYNAANGTELTEVDFYALTDEQRIKTPATQAVVYTLIEGTDYDVTYGDNTNAGAGTVKITAKGNFSGEVTKTFTIAPKGFIAANVTVAVTIDPNGYEYSGQAQAPVVTVTDKTTQQALAAADFDVYYKIGNAEATTVKPTNAAENIKITVKGKRNYTTDEIDPDKTYTIAPANALVTVTATREYDGSTGFGTVKDAEHPGNTTTVTITYQGFLGNETANQVAVANGAYSLVADAADVKNADDYALNVDATKFTLANYTFVANTSKLTITKKALTVTAEQDKKVTTGTADANINYTVTVAGNINADAANLVVGKAFKVTKATEASQDGSYVLTPSANESATDAEKATLANYNPNYVNGKLTYTAGKLVIAINEEAAKAKLTKVYDGTFSKTITLTAEDLVLSPSISTQGLTLPTATIIGVGEDVDNGAKNVGTYQVKLSGAAMQNYECSYINSTFKVTPKTLTVAISDQTLKAGQTINTGLFTVNGIIDGEGAAEDFFALQLDAASYADAEHKTTVRDGAEPGDHIILVEKQNGIASNYNGWSPNAELYVATDDEVIAGTKEVGAVKVPAAVGKLIIANAETIVIDANNTITTTASAGAVNVTFSSDRVLNPQHWNAMVLPFEVTVAKLSQAFGYAVVNRLNTTATTADAVKFSLEMEKIPANEPFLIKVVGKLNGTAYEAVALNGVTIPGVTIVATTAETETSVSAEGNTFKGVYAAEPLTGDKVGFLYDGTDRENKWYVPRAKTYNIQPLDAYLTYATAKAPIITVEDFDGTVTAIQTVNAGEFRQVESEGWYTLGGLKLQGAPTQKGVYINNGKKVVIK